MGSSRLTRTARGDVVRPAAKPTPTPTPKPDPVEVAEATGERSVEGRDPRRDPWPGDVVEDDQSRVRVLEVWFSGGDWLVAGERFRWRRRKRGVPEAPPSWRGWTLESWRSNMIPRDPRTAPDGKEIPGWSGARVVERASERVEAIPDAREV